MAESSGMLSGSKVLVTGASSGIGLAVAKTLTRHGAHVVGTGRNAEPLADLKAEGHVVDYVVVDLCSPPFQGEDGAASLSPCEYLVGAAHEKLGRGLTAVVNCAGVLETGVVGEATVDNYDYNMNINTRVPFEIMTHAVPLLKAAAEEAKFQNVLESDGPKVAPSIVNVSSVNGKQSFPGCAAYCMSKAALDMMTKVASVDLAKHGIRANNVNPGAVPTQLQKRGGISDDRYDAFMKRQVEVTHPLGSYLGRCGKPDEVGELVAFLLSDKAAFLTGECIAMDGGRQNLGAR